MAYRPAWFDPEYYAAQKEEQMNVIKYRGQDDWTVESYKAELENFRDDMGEPLYGETVEDKAFTNFLACNGADYSASVARSGLNVAPNEYFNVGVYLQNLANYYTSHEQPGAPAGGWTIDSVLQYLYSDLHMSAWEHYTTVGMYANIDPSNEFSTRAYMRARVNAMNSVENSNGTTGWAGRNDWTLEDVQKMFADADLNPVMDFYEHGDKIFKIKPEASAHQVELPENWTPWNAIQEYNPYDDVEATVEMTLAQTSYNGVDGVNTRFEAVWNNATEESTIANTDTINGGAGAYNTLALTLDAPWPGFRGQNGPNVENIGRIELLHGEISPATPYTFDARNINGAERVDIVDNGPGAISLKNIGASIKQVNIHNLSPAATQGGETNQAVDSLIQTTSIEHAQGAVAGFDDKLSLGLENVGLESAPAPIKMAGVENLTVNALAGDNFVNLYNATGVKKLLVAGDGNVKITSVANGIESYDASQSTGAVNIAASDLKAAALVKGGAGMDTLTLTQNFTGTPVSWTAMDALAINPGVSAAIVGTNIQGLSSLWVNSGENVSLTNLPATQMFNLYECFANSRGTINLMGGIQNLNISSANYAAAEGYGTKAKIYSDVANNVTINSLDNGNLGGSFSFSKAAGAITLNVAEQAQFSGAINAASSASFTANINGSLVDGVKINAVDKAGANGAVTINVENGISGNKQVNSISIDSDGAAEVNINAKGDFALDRNSSFSAARTVNITLDGNEANLDISQVKLPDARNININGGDEVHLGDIGSSSLNSNMELKVNDAETFSAGKMATGNGNIVANISANGAVILDDISASGSSGARGDAHLTVAAENVMGNGGFHISGADIFINFSEVTDNAFANAQAALKAAESINFLGAAGSDNIRVNGIGSRGPSHIDLGDGADFLGISSGAVSRGQNVRVDIELGEDTVKDVISVGSQTGGKLGLYINDFVEGIDEIAGFHAARITQSQAQSLLSGFGVVDIPSSGLELAQFGSGNGVLYDGDLYGFNSGANATTMVVLTGVGRGIGDLTGIEPEPEEPEPAA